MNAGRHGLPFPLLVAWVGCLLGVASGVIGIAQGHLGSGVAIATGLMFAGAWLDIPYGWAGRSMSIDLEATSCLIALAALPRSTLLVAAAGVAVGSNSLRRAKSLLKVSFNAGSLSITFAIALALANATATGHSSARLFWLTLIILGKETIQSALLSGALASATRQSWRSQFVQQWRTSIPHTLIATGIGAAIVVSIDHPELWPIPVASASLFGGSLWWFAHRSTQFDALESLAAAAAPVQAYDPMRALEEITQRAMSLFSCERVETSALSPGGDGWWTCIAEASEPIRVVAVATEPAAATHPLTQTIELRGAWRGEEQAVLGRVVLHLGQRPRRSRSENNIVHLFAQAAVGAWTRVLDHQALLTEERERQEEIRQRIHAQTHEALTGLPNHTQLDLHIDTALAQGRSVAVLLVRLNSFREVNEILGHHSADTLLREVAHRLRTSVRTSDMVSRIDGAQFAIALIEVPGSHVMSVADEIHGRLHKAMTIDGLSVAVDVAIGVAHGPADASSAVGLLRCAEVASAAADRSGGRTQPYDASQEQGSADDLRLLSELADAVERDEFVLHYQPKVDLRTGAIIGAEALVRWQHPTMGLLAPPMFINHLEHSALILPVTLSLVERALMDSLAWPESPEADQPLTIAVNLGARCLLDASLPEALARLCRLHAVANHRLVLEITETMAVSPLPVAQRVLDGLREAGFSLSVDDFGTGYSSLKFLHYNRVAEIKIDRSFVADVVRDPSSRAIIGATVSMAHDLGMRTVAEGVEDIEQLAMLARLGVDQVQGYLLARPMAAYALEGHLAATPVDPWVMAVREGTRVAG